MKALAAQTSAVVRCSMFIAALLPLLSSCAGPGGDSAFSDRTPVRAIDSELLRERQAEIEMRETVASSQSLASEEKEYIDAVIAYRVAEKRYDRTLDHYDSLLSKARSSVDRAERDYQRAMKVKTYKEARQYIHKAKRYKSMALNVQRAEKEYAEAASDLDRAALNVNAASKKLVRKRKERVQRGENVAQTAVRTAETPAATAPLAIGGYDPVAYFRNGEAAEGMPAIHCEWNGKTWYFVSEEDKEFFNRKPDLFAPRFGGQCAWAMAQGRMVPGDPAVWKVFDNRLYLHQNTAVQAGWALEVEGNIASAERFWRDMSKGNPDDGE